MHPAVYRKNISQYFIESKEGGLSGAGISIVVSYRPEAGTIMERPVFPPFSTKGWHHLPTLGSKERKRISLVWGHPIL